MKKKKVSSPNLLWLLLSLLIICSTLLMVVLKQNGYSSGIPLTTVQSQNSQKVLIFKADLADKLMTLELLPDQSATLFTDYKNGKVIIQTGKWAVYTKGLVSVQLTRNSGEKTAKQVSMLFEVSTKNNLSSLTLVKPDTRVWGKDGLKMHDVTK